MVTFSLALVLKPHSLVFPCMSLVPLKLPPLCWSTDECLWVNLYMTLSEDIWVSSRLPSHQDRWMKSSLLLTPGCCGYSSSQYRILGLGSLIQGEPLLLRCPSQCSMTTCGLESSCFVSPPLLPVLKWLLLHILTYMDFVQLDFRWFSRLIALYCSCHLNVIMEGSRHSICLFCHLGNFLLSFSF